MDSKELYNEIQKLIIQWSNDGTRTAGELTREIMELIPKHKGETLDTDFMYKWINKHSNKNPPENPDKTNSAKSI